MRKLLCLLAFTASLQAAYSQMQPAVIDSFKAQIARAATTREKFDLTGHLSKVLMNVNPPEADKYGKQLIELAEESRDRSLMIRARLINGERYSYLYGRTENIEKAILYYNEGLSMARANKIDTLIVSAFLSLSEVHRYIPNPEKALSFCNQAYSYTGILENDSLTARVHLEYGMVYIAKNEKLLALRNMMSALRIAEELDNPSLLRSGYTRLSGFYSQVEDFDKAIDYQVKAQQTLDRIHSGQTPYNRVQDLSRIGDLYAGKKNYDMANVYYERSLNLADSLKFDPLKSLSYRSIVNNYLNSGQPQKALEYFNKNRELISYLGRIGFSHFVDQSYGYIYMQLGKYDSAKYYYNKIAPVFENDVNATNQYSYVYQLGLLHMKTGEIDKSLGYFLKAKEIGDRTGNLEIMRVTAEMLDSVYQRKGDYKESMFFARLNTKYKDSIDKLGEEKDLLAVEATDEQQRQERVAREKEEKKRKRHSIQYLGITIGIAGLFVLLVMMGMFKVSVNTIKAIGFFVFLMFFEFIFLIFKKNIYAITKGEPWKDLLFMIALAALLLPLHHWLEHKVIKYLTSHNRLTAAGHHIRNKLFRRTKEGEL
jgi:tetratricopeptide (TPR) repeat protein